MLQVCREIPRVCAIFDLDLTEAQVRHSKNSIFALAYLCVLGCRVLFEENKDIKDPRVIHRLILQGNLNVSITLLR